METIEGKYLGKYKSDGIMYFMFSPQEVKEDKKSRFYRIGDDSEEFGTNRKYILINVNESEQKLIDNV